MFNRIKANFTTISNWKWYLLIALLLRGAIWLYFGHLVHINLPANQKIGTYFVKDDYIYFFAPVENYFKTGTYSYIGTQPFTGRLPGYSAIYYLLRLLFSAPVSVVLVVILQFLVSALSVYVLALTASLIFNNKHIFHITYWIYLLAVFPGFFDFFIIAESFSVSALIFCLYYTTIYLQDTRHNKALLLSGLFLAATIFLREYTGLLIIIFPATIGIYHLFTGKHALGSAIKAGLLFCLPFIVFDAAWIVRNYEATGKLIPITSSDNDSYGKLYSTPWNDLDDLVYVWGENASPFDKSTLGYYYREPAEKINYKFPKRIFNNVHTYNADSLVSLRKLYKTFYYTKDSALALQTGQRIHQLCVIYRNDYVSNNFFAYWIVKPLKDLRYMVLFSGTGYLPLPSFHMCSLKEKLIKLGYTIFYYLILISGALGIVWYFIVKRKISTIATMALLVILVVPGTIVFYSPIQEPRYFVHGFTILLLFAVYFINEITMLPGRQIAGKK